MPWCPHSDGHLTKLVLMGDSTGNLICKTFPPQLANFVMLNYLDISNNWMLGNLSQVRPGVGRTQE